MESTRAFPPIVFLISKSKFNDHCTTGNMLFKLKKWNSILIMNNSISHLINIVFIIFSVLAVYMYPENWLIYLPPGRLTLHQLAPQNPTPVQKTSIMYNS